MCIENRFKKYIIQRMLRALIDNLKIELSAYL